MATLKVWETVRGSIGLPLIRLDDRMTYQSVSFTTTAGQSAPFSEVTSVLVVKSDAACAIRVGTNPTAVATDFPLEADTRLEIEVQPGARISAVTV